MHESSVIQHFLQQGIEQGIEQGARESLIEGILENLEVRSTPPTCKQSRQCLNVLKHCNVLDSCGARRYRHRALMPSSKLWT